MKNTLKLSLFAATAVLAFAATATASTLTVEGKAYKTNVGKVIPVTGNQQIRIGDQFTTGENSKVTIQLNNSCQIQIPPLHFVKITDLNKCPSARPIHGAVAHASAVSDTAGAMGSTGATGAPGAVAAATASGTGVGAGAGASIMAATGLSATALTVIGVAAVGGAVAIASNKDDKPASPD